jgi:hypothetical protein
MKYENNIFDYSNNIFVNNSIQQHSPNWFNIISRKQHFNHWFYFNYINHNFIFKS